MTQQIHHLTITITLVFEKDIILQKSTIPNEITRCNLIKNIFV